MIKYIVKCYRRDECVREETFDTYNAAKHFYDNTPGIGSKDFGDTGTYDKVAWFKLNQVELDMWTRNPKYVNPTIKDVHTEIRYILCEELPHYNYEFSTNIKDVVINL
jgi:hypothetical protein